MYNKNVLCYSEYIFSIYFSQVFYTYFKLYTGLKEPVGLNVSKLNGKCPGRKF